MANYKDIRGTTIRNSAGNLSGAVKGELFYDSTNIDFKYQDLLTLDAKSLLTSFIENIFN